MGFHEPVQLFERHCSGMINSDVEELRRVYAKSAFYYDPLGGKIIGSEQIAAYLASLGAYFDSFKVDVVNAWTFNEHAAIEWYEVTSRGGNEQIQRGLCLILARDSMIEEHRDFFTLGRPQWAQEMRQHLALPAAARHH